MVRTLSRDIPPEYLDGVAAIDVSPRTVPHPLREGVYTLGECIALHGDGHEITSRVVLYHGSFQALARDRGDFDWRLEAWETLLHELRHHLEWRASADALEAYDWAAEQNFARQEGRPFDPLFYRSGEVMAADVYRVDDDVFVERVGRALPATAELRWEGHRYRIPVPADAMPLFLVLERLRDPGPGDVVLVFRRKPRLRDLFRGRSRAEVRHVTAECID